MPPLVDATPAITEGLRHFRAVGIPAPARASREELATRFGLALEELNLDLGPLGRLT